MLAKTYRKGQYFIIFFPITVFFVFLVYCLFITESFLLTLTQALKQTSQATIAIKEYPSSVAIDEITNAITYSIDAKEKLNHISFLHYVPVISIYYEDSVHILNCLVYSMDGSLILLKDTKGRKNIASDYSLFKSTLMKAETQANMIHTSYYPLVAIKNQITRLQEFPKKLGQMFVY